MEKIAAACKNVVGVKYSFADMRRINDYLQVRDGNFSVVPGADDLFLPCLACGCDGVVSGCSGPFPEAFVSVSTRPSSPAIWPPPARPRWRLPSWSR
ncbi:MAG: dihydrodipicolinate synthase family protein [Lawsonibacter sp.]